MNLRIKNWKKYQEKRADVAHPSWFRFSNSFFEDPAILELDHTEICFLIYLFTIASKHNSDIASVSVTHARRIGNFSEKQIEQCSKRLISLGLIEDDTGTLRPRNEDVPSTDYKQTNKQTQQTNKQIFALTDSSESIPASVLPEFASIQEILRERKVSLASQKAIADAFPEPEWVISEIRKMIAWEAANPSRKKKRFAAFATRWLTRGWDSRKHSPKNNGKSDYSFLEGL